MSDQVKVTYALPAEIAARLGRINGVEAVLTGLVRFMDGQINDVEVMYLIDGLTRPVDLPGYQAMQHGRAIWSRPDEGE